jgi:hypothetical protein
LFLLLLNSCASYNYSDSKSVDDKTITITTNAPNCQFKVSDSKGNPTYLKSYTNYNSDSKTIVLPNLKKRNLSIEIISENYNPVILKLNRVVRGKALIKDIALGIFTFGAPIIVDAFRSDFYKIDPDLRDITLNMVFKDSFMEAEFEKIANSQEPEDFTNWLSLYKDSRIYENVLDKRDSLELSIAIRKESEEAIDKFISTHPKSNSLPKAQEIKSEMVVARNAYINAVQIGSMESFLNFIDLYPNSIYNSEIHRKLVDLKENLSIESGNIDDMLDYVIQYLYPNKSYLSVFDFELKKAVIANVIDDQLIKDFHLSSQINDYAQLSNFWKSLIDLKNTLAPYKLPSFNKSLSFQSNISDLLFVSLSGIKSQEIQTNFLTKVNIDFPEFNFTDINKTTLDVILSKAKNGNGQIVLFNSDYFLSYFKELSSGNRLKGMDFYEYKGTKYFGLNNIKYEEISFKNGKLNGVSKCFDGENLVFQVSFLENTPKEVAYFQNGKLVRVNNFKLDGSMFYYEFENGTNLTLKFINDELLKLSNIETRIKSLTKENKFDQLAITYEEMYPITDPLYEYLRKNPIPSEKAESLIRMKTQSIESLSKIAMAKEEKIRVAEENKRIEKERIASQNAERIRQAEYAKELARRKNEVHICHYCPNRFTGLGYSCNNRDGEIWSGASRSGGFAEQIGAAALGVEYVPRPGNFCSVRCARKAYEIDRCDD